jgi:hypothetical protein
MNWRGMGLDVSERFHAWRSKSLPPMLMVSTTIDGFYFANCVLAAVFLSLIISTLENNLKISLK